MRRREDSPGRAKRGISPGQPACGYACSTPRKRQSGLVDNANDECPSFVDGRLGLKFRNAGGEFVHLDGHARSRASADLYLTLLYSLTGDVAHLYDVSFDWRR